MIGVNLSALSPYRTDADASGRERPFNAEPDKLLCPLPPSAETAYCGDIRFLAGSEIQGPGWAQAESRNPLSFGAILN